MAERHPEVRREIDSIEDTLQRVAEEFAKTPPPQLFDRIQARISAEESASEPEATPPKEEVIAKKTKKIHYWQYGVAATFTLKLAFMAVAANFWLKWQNTENQLSTMQERYGQLQQESQQTTQALLAISDPAFQTLVLQGTEAGQEVRVLAYWNEATQELYVNPNQLPPTKAGEQYQLWGQVGGDTISLGTFNVASGTSLPQILSFQGKKGLWGLSVSVIPEGEDERVPPSPDQIYAQGVVQ